MKRLAALRTNGVQFPWEVKQILFVLLTDSEEKLKTLESCPRRRMVLLWRMGKGVSDGGKDKASWIEKTDA